MSAGLKNNILSLTFLQLANYIAPLLLIPYLLRSLGSEQYGIIAIILGMTQFCYIITEFGFSQSATAKIAEKSDDISFVSKMNGAVIIIKVGIAAICFIMSSAFLYVKGYGDTITISALFSIIIFQALQPVWFFNGIEKMGRLSVFLVASKLLYCLLAILFVSLYRNYQSAIVSMAISSCIGCIIGYWFLYKTKYCIAIPTVNETKEEFLYSLQFFWARGAVSLYTSLCVVLVGTFSGLQQAALFSVCEQIFKAGKAVTAPLCQALYPYLIRTKNWKLFFKLFVISAVIMFIGCGVVIAGSGLILSYVFALHDQQGPIILMFLVFGVYVSYLSVYFGHLALMPLKKIKVANNSVLFGAGFFVLINLFLYNYYEINALHMALTILVTEIIIAVIRIVAFIKAYKTLNVLNKEHACE